MADDWQDIGSGIDLFPLEPNWASEPETTINIARDLRKYEGTATEVDVLTSKTPIGVDCQFLLTTDEENYTFIDFFVSHKARLNRFWFKHPKRAFTLKEFAAAGSDQIKVNPNFSNLMIQGYERTYINVLGEYISRQITGAIYDEVNDHVILTLNTITDRDLYPEQIYEFGYLILCRYDIDTLTLDYESDCVSVAKVKFYELVEEYADI